MGKQWDDANKARSALFRKQDKIFEPLSLFTLSKKEKKKGEEILKTNKYDQLETPTGCTLVTVKVPGKKTFIGRVVDVKNLTYVGAGYNYVIKWDDTGRDRQPRTPSPTYWTYEGTTHPIFMKGGYGWFPSKDVSVHKSG